MNIQLIFIVFVTSVLLVTFSQNSAFGDDENWTNTASDPLHESPDWTPRPLGEGPGFYVDAKGGDDANDGTQDAPWHSVQHALAQLSPGDTLYLREGVYFENIRCSVVGTQESPITIRSYPGERAIIDGSIADFQTDFADAWEPVGKGSPDTYVSKKTYKNQRDMIGMLGDSLAGLTTYWYRRDLEAKTGLVSTDEATQAIAPFYCGPGIWYEQVTGAIYCRLAHTDLQSGMDEYTIRNYKGERDPRKLPLVVAPFHARALHVDQAQHVRFLDLVFRGGGYETVRLDLGINLTFDRCVIHAGTYGIASKGTGPLTMTDSRILGNIPPWAFRQENCLAAYSPYISPPFITTSEGYRKYESGRRWQKENPNPRHIARLNTHALLVTEGYAEHEVFAYPFNHDWEIARCEFFDAHDGVYLSGRNIDFHHNVVAAVQDDAVYLSSPTPSINDDIHVHHNLIAWCTTAFGTHGQGGPGGDIYVYRNIVDMRDFVQYNRGTIDKPKHLITRGPSLFLLHGGEKSLLHQENIYFYQNTVLSPKINVLGGGITGGIHEDASRWILNNIILSYSKDGTALTPRIPRTRGDLWLDGNLYWQLDAALDSKFCDIIRESPGSLSYKESKGDSWAIQSLMQDPLVNRAFPSNRSDNDYRLSEQSPAIRAGLPLPDTLFDPDAPTQGLPDLGALPLGADPLTVGVLSRINAGSALTPLIFQSKAKE